MHTETSIYTHSGKSFDLARPEPHMVDIIDIAEALSKLCRFTGHTRAHYSVAQHCVLVSQFVHDPHKLAGLLHDAAEAYVGDMNYPLKRSGLVTGYDEIEAGVARAIFKRFGVPTPIPQVVKVIDRRMAYTEMKWLMPTCPDPDMVLPLVITPWSAQEARDQFLNRFDALRIP